MWELILGAFLGVIIGLGAGWLVWRRFPQEKIREINYQKLLEE